LFQIGFLEILIILILGLVIIGPTRLPAVIKIVLKFYKRIENKLSSFKNISDKLPVSLKLFIKSLLSEFKEIEKAIYTQKNREILICGHSSAGAKSVILGHYLAINHPTKRFTIVTFGSPKTGDYKFYQNIETLRNLNIISVNFRDDLVPLLGFGISKPDRQVEIFSHERCYHLIKSHLMLRYEEALIHNTELYHCLERNEDNIFVDNTFKFNIN